MLTRITRFVSPMIRQQHIIERADARAFPASALILEPVGQSVDQAHVANGPALAQLRSEIDALKAGLPFSLLESRSLKMQVHTAELYLCLIGISTNPGLNTLPDGLSAPPAGEQWPPWRLEFLSAGIVAAKTLLDFYLLQPLNSEMNHNNTEWIQISFALTLAARLAVLANQRQEMVHLRSFLDMAGVLKGLLSRMQCMVTDEVDNAGDRSFFYLVERRLRRLQNWFEAQTCPVAGSLRGPQHHDAAQAGISLDQAPGQQRCEDAGPAALEMTMPLLQSDFSTGWMEESWFDGLMDFPELGNHMFDDGSID